MDQGGSQRREILKREAERRFVGPLKTHGWHAVIECESPSGEYLMITASRGTARHRVALLYSSATDNRTYKNLASQVEHIFHQGDPYHLEQYTHGISVPIASSSSFGALLVNWNRETNDGKFSPVDDRLAHATAEKPSHRKILAENPLKSIWLRLRQLQSLTLAKKLVRARASIDSAAIANDVIASKAEGIAYALRNAADYYTARDIQNVSQRVLNLYYGSMAFATAEMLAYPRGSKALSEIERSTVQGHGLYTIDGVDGGLENLVVGAISTGFFPEWLRTCRLTDPAFPGSKARKYSDLSARPQNTWITIEELFATIPELGDLFADIFESKPRWVTPAYDSMANMALHGFGSRGAGRSYVLLIDDSARLEKNDIAKFPGPIGEITAIASEKSGRHFRVGIDHQGHDYWWGALKIHHSPFERNSLIQPIFGQVDDFRCICLVLLYALSIIVRYRPSLWRRVQEGDLDHFRALIEAFLAVVERVLPEQFLEKISGQSISAHQPGSFFS